ncbi:MAG: murein L,D-transpeptidase catalytic domain-containing protein [Parvularculaceae bacterium]
MSLELRVDRRNFLKAGAIAAAASLAPTISAARGPDKQRLLAIAKAVLKEKEGEVAHRDVVALADFSAPSWIPRFHLVDLSKGEASSLLTAHGRGSDPGHTGWVKSFSNELGSNASSDGAYVTGVHYDGKYGRAIRLAGLDPENSNAERRAIVIHQAWYVSEAMIAQHGKLGRSEGCFALSEQGLQAALAALGPGRLLFAGKLSEMGV